MKFIAIITAVCLLAMSVAAAPAVPSCTVPTPVSIPAPPCPKNYLFSCQAKLTVPFSAPAPSYGSAGAYSQYAPIYTQQPLRW